VACQYCLLGDVVRGVLGQTSRVQRPARRTCQPRDPHVLPAPSPVTGAPREPSRPSRCRATKVDHALAPVARPRRSPSGRSCVHRCSGPAGFHGRPPVRLSCGTGRRGVTGVAKHRHASQCFDGIRHIDRSIRIRHIARSLARSTIRIRSSSLDHSLARSTIRSLARPFASLSPRLVPLHFASLRFASRGFATDRVQRVISRAFVPGSASRNGAGSGPPSTAPVRRPNLRTWP
jgi:hypothetical protein